MTTTKNTKMTSSNGRNLLGGRVCFLSLILTALSLSVWGYGTDPITERPAAAPKTSAQSVSSPVKTGKESTDFDAYAADRMRRVVKVLRTTNKAQVNQFVPVAFEFKHTNPFAAIRFIRRPIEAEEGNWWTFVHPDGDKGLLLINVPIWQVEPMKDLIAVLDRPGITSSSGDKRYFHYLNHRDPSDQGFLDSLATVMHPTAKIIPVPAIGGVYLEDSYSGVDAAIKKINEELDEPTKQILLRTKVFEIDLKNDGTIGLDYHAWKNGPGRNLFAGGYFAEQHKTSQREALGVDGAGDQIYSGGPDSYGMPGRRLGGDGRNGAFLLDVSSSYLDFLVTKGRARVLTEPSIMVRNHREASFSTGEQILYYKTQNGPSGLAGVRPEGLTLDPNGDDARYPDNRSVTGALTPRAIPSVADAGVSVEVEPTIAQNLVNLDLNISIVSQLGFDDTGVPMLSHRDIETGIHVRPDEEYLLGGMTRTRVIQSSSKVPVLGSIPGLGWLFGGEKTTTQKTMVIMAVSAQIVDDYEGLSERASDVIEQVEALGMSQIEMPEPLTRK